jgi:hypothetical protein
MRYKIGRALQLVAMLILPVAIAGQATEHLTLGQMLTWTAAGIVLFAAGWMLQDMGGRN